jgi:hypothetical protein
MSFIRRLGYYLGGFSLGLVFLFFFLSGKKTQCNYGPQARVINDISGKIWRFVESDSMNVNKSIFLKKVNIDFSKSQIGIGDCNTYYLENHLGAYNAKNCDSIVYFKKIR